MFIWIIFALAQLADVITTRIGLSLGAAEGNPVVGKFMSVFGPYGWIAAKLGIAVFVAWRLWVSGAEVLIWLIIAVTAAFVVNNIRVIRKLR